MRRKRTLDRGPRPELIWGLGLTDSQQKQISNAVGPGFFLRNYPEGGLPSAPDLQKSEKPASAWIPWHVWSTIPESSRMHYRQLESPRILIQDEPDDSLEMEQVLEEGFLTVVRSPLTRSKVQDAIFRAKEISSMYSDIYRMTEEIMLERELLSRKTDQLLFLNRVMTSASESLEPALILDTAREHLGMLLPVRAMHAAFWQESEDGETASAEIFLSGRLSKVNESRWIETLLASGGRLGGLPVGSYQISSLDAVPVPGSDIAPDGGRLSVMPLSAGQDTFGCLAILSDPAVKLGKDQVETFRAAVNHLGLALRNALLYKEVKLQADRDGLTRVYNRRTFEERLIHELRRRQRYSFDLSLLMVDLDHFKAVNDTYGHLSGDNVLKRVGEVLLNSIRATDMCARYGGEEFAVLLPHASEADAWKLAERIRTRVEALEFSSDDGKKFKVTASIGVSSVESGSLAREGELVLKADKALYQAKHNGRNVVVVSSETPTTASARRQ